MENQNPENMNKSQQIKQLQKDIKLAKSFQRFGQSMMGERTLEHNFLPMGNIMLSEDRKIIGEKLKMGKKLNEDEEKWHWGLRFWATGVLDECEAREKLRALRK